MMRSFDGIRGRYRVIAADPPWSFHAWSRENQLKAASNHYAVMTLADIKALPVSDRAADDCMLVLWATQPMIPQALDVMEAWGFRYKTTGVWAKQSTTGEGWAFGT